MANEFDPEDYIEQEMARGVKPSIMVPINQGLTGFDPIEYAAKEIGRGVKPPVVVSVTQNDADGVYAREQGDYAKAQGQALGNAAALVNDPNLVAVGTDLRSGSSAVRAATQAANDAGAYLSGVQSAISGLPTGAQLPLQATSRTIMAGFTGQTAGRQAQLSEAGRAGLFEWVTGNQNAAVTSDPDQAFYVPPVATPNGSAGVWRRVLSAGIVFAAWAGVTGAQADQAPALKRLLAHPLTTSVLLPATTIYAGRAIMIPSGKAMYGQGRDVTIIKALPGFFYDTNDAVQPSNNAVVYGMRDARNIRTGDYSIDGSKVGDHFLNGVTMFNCRDFLVERVSSKDLSGYARWACGDGAGLCSGQFIDQFSENANVHFETTRVKGVRFIRCKARNGDGDIDCETMLHAYTSSDVHYIDCDVEGVAASGALVGNYGSNEPDMVDIRFIRCRIKMTANPGPVGLAINGFNGGIRGIRVEDCDISCFYIGINVGSDSGKAVEIDVIGGSITAPTEILSFGPATRFLISKTRLKALGGPTEEAAIVPLGLNPSAIGVIDAPIIDVPHANVVFSSSPNHRVVSPPVYFNTAVMQTPIGPGHKITRASLTPTKTYDNGGDVIPGLTFNVAPPGTYRVTVDGSYTASAVGIAAIFRVQSSGTTRLLDGRAEVASKQYGNAGYVSGPLSNENTGAVGEAVDAANANRSFRATAVFDVTSVDCALLCYISSQGDGTVKVAATALTIERIA